jgi:hypothetical protein
VALQPVFPRKIMYDYWQNEGKRVIITNRKINNGTGIIHCAPNDLVGVKGTIRIYEDTVYPTGYKRYNYWIEIDKDTPNHTLLLQVYGHDIFGTGEKYIPVDAAFILIEK